MCARNIICQVNLLPGVEEPHFTSSKIDFSSREISADKIHKSFYYMDWMESLCSFKPNACPNCVLYLVVLLLDSCNDVYQCSCNGSNAIPTNMHGVTTVYYKEFVTNMYSVDQKITNHT